MQAYRRKHGRNEANRRFSPTYAKAPTNGAVHEERADITNTADFNIVYCFYECFNEQSFRTATNYECRNFSHTSGTELPLRAEGPVALYKLTAVGHAIQQFNPLPVFKQHNHN